MFVSMVDVRVCPPTHSYVIESIPTIILNKLIHSHRNGNGWVLGSFLPIRLNEKNGWKDAFVCFP